MTVTKSRKKTTIIIVLKFDLKFSKKQLKIGFFI